MSTGPTLRVLYGHSSDIGGQQLTPYVTKAREVSFTMTAAGVTEFITSDGWRIQLRIHVKAIRASGAQNKDGVPVYDIDFEVTPKFIPALTVSDRALGEAEN